ncbi:hypothetical protein A2996_00365 [Candidatus Campbellbacteria bacterium RIFCSPLOWO2_01_FULL_34_15]|uniref:Uncharacterized protein n=1 Tax=Candidatus Campbellbacteria bacterium RIFCSPLOWO2_01_FULL_34_15 TaxID=1797579 RepID=A0A1F5EME9_9BACT|nr:MAG: hypothetical protein A2996_00365 [Candidatus Campbellbacteria bacterium RIFCSPLOWO2_01_FULL_34_15]
MLFFGLFVHHADETGQVETTAVQFFSIFGIHERQATVGVVGDAEAFGASFAGEFELLATDYFFSCFHVGYFFLH